jgi:hypothetical protein
VLAEQEEISADHKHSHQRNDRDCVEKVRHREIFIVRDHTSSRHFYSQQGLILRFAEPDKVSAMQSGSQLQTFEKCKQVSAEGRGR